jgi:hypothetical protein
VWCKDCRRQVEPGPTEHARRYGEDIPVPEWRERLVGSKCGNRAVKSKSNARTPEFPTIFGFGGGDGRIEDADIWIGMLTATPSNSVLHNRY